MVLFLPGGRQIIDGGDRDLCFETASDEGAYHPCPTLAIPPPAGGRANLELSQCSVHRGRRQILGRVGETIGIVHRHSPFPKFGCQPVRSPAPFGRAYLNKSVREPFVVQ